MPTNNELVASVLDETLACQDPESIESQGRLNGDYAPIGPHIAGGYPTTDKGMAALADLADRFRANEPGLTRTIDRDGMRLLASEVTGKLLNELAAEPDRGKHWAMVREVLKTRVSGIGRDLVHYVPVWLFLNQACEPFVVGPVRLIRRTDWLEAISNRRGESSEWMPGVQALWAGRRLKGGAVGAGAVAAAKAFLKAPTHPSTWRQAYMAGMRASEPNSSSNARTVARLIHPDQWIACAQVDGFAGKESRRRGLLAARVALDTIRLALPAGKRGLISTASDSTIPFSEDRLSQAAGEDLAHGWGFNRRGIGGSPGLAQDIVGQSKPLFEAAGACIAAAVSPQAHGCPGLAERWFNATHWYGRACLADEDFVAVVMLVIALDVLCGGLEGEGILELIARLTATPVSQAVLDDGASLKKLVERTYRLRSEVAHGSVLAVHEPLDLERAQLEALGSVALRNYVIELDAYAKRGGSDDRDAFRNSLPPPPP